MPGLRDRARHAALPVMSAWQRARHRGMGSRERWEDGLDTEVRFWRAYLRHNLEPGGPGHYRVDPDWSLEEDAVLAPVVAGLDGDRVRILDVGAGPLTVLGKRCPGKAVEIAAIDPLAEAYDRLLAEAGIDPLVRTRAGHGEQVAELFAPASFDVAYSSNALDHGYDPAAAIAAMVAVVRPGGAVVLRHARNEGETQRYLGLHQWNLDARDGELVVWRPGEERNVSRELAGRARGDVRVQDGELIAVLTVEGPC
ncbi:hypothetical protein DSM104329_05166 [Capillimicrobium parvum]|uniref:Methyltransferase type 11 domain-containing protein n=2 Tax=Capillimicrobium parvum TaxID=2884022 RepID=A0A9E6Y3E6_9ACTN|nr:hypothetical protein DSM104329_05166 [Capillimicrobium parvum]